jgi:hypothetical protein
MSWLRLLFLSLLVALFLLLLTYFMAALDAGGWVAGWWKFDSIAVGPLVNFEPAGVLIFLVYTIGSVFVGAMVDTNIGDSRVVPAPGS